MTRSLPRWLLLALALAGCTAPVAPPPGGNPVTLRFRAVMGSETLETSPTDAVNSTPVFTGIGADARTVRALDFRFYVHDVALKDAGGAYVPLSLDATDWQHRNLALIDLDRAMTTERNDVVTGRVPPGTYRGVRFTLGVPADLNHTDAAVGPAPGAPHAILAWGNHATSMGWSWLMGRKYAKVELAVRQTPDTETPFYFHLGGLGASNPTKVEGPSYGGFDPARTTLAEPNLVVVDLPDLDPTTDVVLADLQPFLANVKLGAGGSYLPTRQGKEDDGNAPDVLLRNLGLRGGGPQTLFRTGR